MSKKFSVIFILFAIISLPLAARPWKYFSIYRHSRLTRFSFEIDGGLSLYSGNYAGFLNLPAQYYGINPSYGLNIGTRITNYVSIRAGAGRQILHAKNTLLNPVAFRNTGWKYNISLIHDFFAKPDFNSRDRKFNFYAIGGLQLMSFGIAEQILSDNTIRAKSSHIALAPFFGAGFQYYFFEDFAVGTELSYNMPFSSMIDGLNGTNDRFITFSLRANWFIWHYKSGYRYKNYLYSGH